MRRGMSLVELVIGVTIIGIAFYLLISLFITITPRTALVETLNRKTYLVQEKIEEYLARDFGAVTSEAATPFPGFSNYYYQIVVTNVATSDFSSSSPGSPHKRVNVLVWGGPVDSLGTVEVVSLVSSYEVN